MTRGILSNRAHKSESKDGFVRERIRTTAQTAPYDSQYRPDLVTRNLKTPRTRPRAQFETRRAPRTDTDVSPRNIDVLLAPGGCGYLWDGPNVQRACKKPGATTKTDAFSTTLPGPMPFRTPLDRYPRTAHENEERPPLFIRNYGPLYEIHASYPAETNRRVHGSRRIR